MARGGALAAAGVLLGLGVSAAFARLIGSLLYQTNPSDPVIYAVTGLFLLSIALGAIFVPTRRASEVDPSVTLRYE
jgi:ABC-type antimicrobial peptide transport system permease subunit